MDVQKICIVCAELLQPESGVCGAEAAGGHVRRDGRDAREVRRLGARRAVHDCSARHVRGRPDPAARRLPASARDQRYARAGHCTPYGTARPRAHEWPVRQSARPPAGMVYLARAEKQKEPPGLVFLALLKDSWPIFLLALVSAGYAALLFWCLVRASCIRVPTLRGERCALASAASHRRLAFLSKLLDFCVKARVLFSTLTPVALRPLGDPSAS